ERAPFELIGPHTQRDGGGALGIALAFGQAEADPLARLAGLALDHGARWLRPAAGRVLLFGELVAGADAGLTAAAERLGFVVRADDPRRRIAACPGKPACSSGWIAARALAAELAAKLGPGGCAVDIHISGCAKGCAHPAAAALTVVGSESGCALIN